MERPARLLSERDTGVTNHRLHTAQSGEQVPRRQAAVARSGITRSSVFLPTPDDKPLNERALMDVGQRSLGGEVASPQLRSFLPSSFALNVTTRGRAHERSTGPQGFEVLHGRPAP